MAKEKFKVVEKVKSEDSPLKKFIRIQDMQFALDKIRKQRAIANTEIRILSQKIPKMIRELSLR